MAEHTHDHDHDHQEHEHITLVDEEGNETLYEILLTIDGQEEFGRNYVLLYPAGADEDEEVELQAYAYVENEAGTEGDLEQIETDKEWDMIEEVFNTFMAEEEE
ncbi:DUF1292 domain-containing protein [Tetragenococcus halophilus]|uniref:UPF0473 protein C7H83_10430 n=2 Tax=Tetragenococcus halophilus TaxID=51669 RepID=A0A3G5FKS6_TETHA|nr:DUF1292 domain-containing protein [Tetragenococcus halophilus]AYW50855.1 DUF1292 domain-containing protein [Tetragenococcus halophilus]MCF1684264.1 DUF1292 domain-containing protein [Tetragenococcus halophilus]MCO8289194.1 DUF1292 domain-containing protein [Tetragenococcus halophilus]MCO8297474.1 DUF1292 domain-containing protein [Tetragenococcus halophilus]MCT8310055.1 DUF1292 domain-containing protein [Tetragenococcus halophilus]